MSVLIPSPATPSPGSTDKPAVPPTEAQMLLCEQQIELSATRSREAAAQQADEAGGNAGAQAQRQGAGAGPGATGVNITVRGGSGVCWAGTRRKDRFVAYSQLSAARVRDAAELALQDLKRDTAESSSGDQRAELTRLRWLWQLADASVQEDEAHRYVTVTADDFDLIAERYADAEADPEE